MMDDSTQERDQGGKRTSRRFRLRTRYVVAFFATLTICILVAVSFATLRSPNYESRWSIVPIDEGDLIRNWMNSRNVSAMVAASMESRLAPVLFPAAWDAGTGSWRGSGVPLDELADKLRDQVRFRIGAPETQTGVSRFLEVVVSMPDPILARDVAEAYFAALGTLRPVLENITRQEAWDRYYRDQFAEGGEEEAKARAEAFAKERIFWITLDTPTTPTRESGPSTPTNLALGLILGALLGSLAAAGVYRWGSRRGKTP